MKYGFKSVTMDDIARELGISKKTLYQYVDNKADLIQQLVAEFVGAEQSLISCIQVEAEDAIQEMLQVGRHIIRMLRQIPPTTLFDMQKYYKESWNIVSEYHQQHVYLAIKSNLERGIQQGVYRANINPDIIAKLYVGKAPVIVNDELFPSNEYNREQLFREFFNYHIHGIASEKGLELLKKHTASSHQSGTASDPTGSAV